MIEKITDQNLERYDSRLKEWCDRKFFEKGNYGKYQTTEESGAVAFYPAPNTPLEGKVKFSFTETPPASGDKGPENLSAITGVSEVKVGRIGKNLLLRVNTGYSGYAITRNADGSLTVNGSGAAMFSVTDGGPDASGTKSSIILDTSKYYTLSVELVSGTVSGLPYVSLVAPSEQDVRLAIPSAGNASKTFIHRISSRFVCRILVSAGESLTNAVLRIQLEEGATATAFEAPMLPTEVSATVSLGNTYYGGEIDLATGVMTVTQEGIVFDGSETFVVGGGATYYHYAFNIQNNASSVIDNTTQTCSHLPLSNNLSNDILHFVCTTTQIHFFVPQSTVSDFKTWLGQQNVAGTPIVVSYLLATPYTVQLTPTQIFSLIQSNKYTPRLNTVYTDADSIQVSYLKSPIRDEYEKTQAILSLGGNS